MGAAPIIIAVLAYFHIISAMAWLGADLLVVSALAPGLRSLSPAASLEFLGKVGPNLSRFYVLAATATIVFGLGLLYALTGDFSLISFSSALGTNLTIGLTFGLLAYLTYLVASPSFAKASRLAREMMTSGQSGLQSPEFTKALMRTRIGTASVTVLLVVTLMFMVAAGFPF